MAQRATPMAGMYFFLARRLDDAMADAHTGSGYGQSDPPYRPKGCDGPAVKT
jgi:hypothetical protein